jgi:hypothetical protein
MNLSRMLFRVTYNGQVLPMAGYSGIVQPGTAAPDLLKSLKLSQTSKGIIQPEQQPNSEPKSIDTIQPCYWQYQCCKQPFLCRFVQVPQSIRL